MAGVTQLLSHQESFHACAQSKDLKLYSCGLGVTIGSKGILGYKQGCDIAGLQALIMGMVSETEHEKSFN